MFDRFTEFGPQGCDLWKRRMAPRKIKLHAPYRPKNVDSALMLLVKHQ